MPKEKGPRPLVPVALNSLSEMPISLLVSSACTPDDSICRATGLEHVHSSNVLAVLSCLAALHAE